ncbi:MAG: ABC transporter ATP-binding protein [Clostridia bacterium]|nr:ABC transporter ATP-binding protein [Clostridia bacterium]
MSNQNQSKNTMPKRGPGMGPRGGMHGGAPVEKAKNFKKSFGRLIKYLSAKKTALIMVLLLAAISSVFGIFGPKILGKATDVIVSGFQVDIEAVKSKLSEPETMQALAEHPEVVEALKMAQSNPGEAQSLFMDKDMRESLKEVFGDLTSLMKVDIDFSELGRLALWIVLLYAISSVFAYIQQIIMAYTSQRIVYGMRNEVKIKLTKLPLKYFDGRTHGEVLSRVTNDIDTISNTLQQSVTQVITAVTTIIGILVMMLTISGWLTLISLVVLPLTVIISQKIIKRSQKFFIDQQKEIGNINGHVEEMYTGHQIVKAFGQEKKSLEQFNEINERLYNVGWKAQFMSGIMMPIMNMVNNLSYVLVCVVGGVLAVNGKITLGDVQAFIQYSRRFTQPIAQTAQIANVMQSAVAAAERVFEVLDEEEQIADPVNSLKLTDAKGAVTFEHVKFGYDKDKTIIKDMNLNVAPGDTIAIVGPTGAGKTTLINLLMRFYEIDNGKITVDGIDITQLSRNELRKEFGMVLQDTWLFNGTIRDNIAYGNPKATDEDIIKCAKMAHADHFIRTLPNGYETVLNEDATNISQGQRQLLTIARALLADPKILILDEATSSVDTRTEAYIQNAMIALMEGRTNFVIAHRLSTIRDASTILVMNEGEVIEQGNHEKLMAQNGFYADLYNSQFTGADLRDKAI